MWWPGNFAFATDRPVGVVVEMTNSTPDRLCRSSASTGSSCNTSPTLTAWNQRQGAWPSRNGTRPNSFSLQPVRYLPRTTTRHNKSGETAARKAQYGRSKSQDMRECLPEPRYVGANYPLAPQHFLYFLPLPHGHGSLRPTFGRRL